MSLRINTNVAALNAYNNLSTNQSKLESAFSQLSSGLRINRAADDASGLAISQNLTSQINGMTQAVSNANDAINVTQIADGALSTVQDILQRMRTLVVQAGNTGSQDQTSLTAIQNEVKALNGQLDAIGSETKYGGKSLLNGTYNTQFQVGAGGGDTVALDLSSVNVNSAQLGAAASGGNNLNALNIATIDFQRAWRRWMTFLSSTRDSPVCSCVDQWGSGGSVGRDRHAKRGSRPPAAEHTHAPCERS